MEITTYRMNEGRVEVKGLGYVLEATVSDVNRILSPTAAYLLKTSGHIRIFKNGKKQSVTAI